MKQSEARSKEDQYSGLIVIETDDLLGGGIGLVGDGLGAITNLGGKAIKGTVALGKQGIDTVSNQTISTI